MSNFHVIALPSEIAAQVRETGKSPRYGHPTQTQVADWLRTLPPLPAHLPRGRREAGAVHV